METSPRRVLCGDKLVYHRDLAMLTQEELAERARLTKSTISRLESGYHRARYTTVKKLAQALGCDPSDLLQPVGGLPGGGGATAALLATLGGCYPILL